MLVACLNESRMDLRAWGFELQNAGFPVKNGAIALPQCVGIGYQLPLEIVKAFGIA